MWGWGQLFLPHLLLALGLLPLTQCFQPYELLSGERYLLRLPTAAVPSEGLLLRTKLQNVNVRVEDLWKANCSLAREIVEVVQSKNDEIAELKCQLASTSVVTPPISTLRVTASAVVPDTGVSVGRGVSDTVESSSESGDATTGDRPLVALGMVRHPQ